MNLAPVIKLGLLAGLLWAASGTAMATTCGYADGNRPSVGNMPLQVANITVGRDVPLGTVVYRQTFKSAKPVAAKCSGPPFNATIGYNYTTTPKGLSGWSSGSYAGKVYLTDVPGLGVAYASSQASVLPWSGPRREFCSGQQECTISFGNISDFEMLLIKIGDVSPGTIRGSSLPTLQSVLWFTGTSVMGYKMGISGTLNIVAKTCETPNVTVPMGTHMISDLNGVNSATPWKDFAIRLNNCPAFLGSYTTSGPGWLSSGGDNPGGTATAGTRVGNRVQFRIDPVIVAFDSNRGILSRNDSAPGQPAAARGIGIQLGNSTGNPLPLRTVHNSGLALRSTAGNYSIALRARYLQVSNTVTPGPANASATFTIIYQ